MTNEWKPGDRVAANARLIAAAREALPALIERVRRAEEALKDIAFREIGGRYYLTFFNVDCGGYWSSELDSPESVAAAREWDQRRYAHLAAYEPAKEVEK